MNTKGIRFTAEQRARLQKEAVELHAEGLGASQISKRLGCSKGTVSTFLAEAGVGGRRWATAEEMAEGTGLLSAAQVAARLGITHGSFNAMRNQGRGPEPTESPQGANSYWTFYRAEDIDRWLEKRRERREERAARVEGRQRVLSEARAAATDYTPNWEPLLAAVDKKRTEQGISWLVVCAAAGIDKGYMSRLRAGKGRGSNWAPFFRLVTWLDGEVPAGIRAYVTETAHDRSAS